MTTPAETRETPKETPNSLDKCSQCKVNDLDTSGYPKWCKSCRARWQREQKVLKGNLAVMRGYARGVREMRELLALKFSELGSGSFNGLEIAHLISAFAGPEFEVELPEDDS